MSASLVSIAAEDSSHRTYQTAWDEYAAGRMSTCVMRRLLADDEVFRRWCIKRAEAERKSRDAQWQQRHP